MESQLETPLSAQRATVRHLRAKLPNAGLNFERLALLWSDLWSAYQYTGAPILSYKQLAGRWDWLSPKQIRDAFDWLEKADLIKAEPSNDGPNRWIPLQPQGSDLGGQGSDLGGQGSDLGGQGSDLGGQGLKSDEIQPHLIKTIEDKNKNKTLITPREAEAKRKPAPLEDLEALQSRLPDKQCREAWERLKDAMRICRVNKVVRGNVFLTLLSEILASIETNSFSPSQIVYGFDSCARAENGAAGNERYFRKAAFSFRPDRQGSAAPLSAADLRETALGMLGINSKLSDVEQGVPAGDGEALRGGWLEQWQSVKARLAQCKDRSGLPYSEGWARNVLLSLLAGAAHADLWPNAIRHGLLTLLDNFDFNACTLAALVKYTFAVAAKYRPSDEEHYLGSPNHQMRKARTSGLYADLARKMTEASYEDESLNRAEAARRKAAQWVRDNDMPPIEGGRNE